MLAYVDEQTPHIGRGNPVQVLEQRVAELLGKQAAVLLPTGKMAQQIALRLHCERRGHNTFAAHPTCHVVNWEHDGYAVVHGLRFRPLGDPQHLFGAADIAAAPEALAAVLWELPQRETGGELPSWAELQQQVAVAREAGAAPHLDGARLWEAQPAYDRPLAEIAALFDSVYVSLYKTLEAPRGAVLAGDEDFISQARSWSVRLGGESAGNWPLALAGLIGLEDVLPRMAAYRDRAREIATRISKSTAAVIRPDPPQTALFHVHLPITPDLATRVHEELAQSTGLQLFLAARETPDPARCAIEISVGEAAMAIDPADIASFVSDLLRRAQQQPPPTSREDSAR